MVFSHGKAPFVTVGRGVPGVTTSGERAVRSYMSPCCGVSTLSCGVHVIAYLWPENVHTAVARPSLWPSTSAPATARIANIGLATLPHLRQRAVLTPQGGPTRRCVGRKRLANCSRLPHDWKVAHCTAYSQRI